MMMAPVPARSKFSERQNDRGRDISRCLGWDRTRLAAAYPLFAKLDGRAVAIPVGVVVGIGIVGQRVGGIRDALHGE